VVVRTHGVRVVRVRFSALRPRICMWYVYILESNNNQKLYTGSTKDLRQRFQEHNSKRGGNYTSRNAPFKLIFYEAYLNKNDALKAEKFFKSGYGREVLKDKLEDYFKNS
jgi:putative endonuclease